MSDQDTPIPGVVTFIRTSKESVLAEDSHSLDFLNENQQLQGKKEAAGWPDDEDVFVVLYEDIDSWDWFTESEWEQRKTELRGIEQVVEAPRVHLFELRSAEEWGTFLSWSQEVLPDSKPATPSIGDIVIARGGRFELFVPEGKDRPEIGHPEGYFDEQRAHIRLTILNTLTDLDDARAAEKWVLGEE